MDSGTTYKRGPLRTGDEYDVVSRYWRKLCCYTKRAGVTAKIKRGIRRRERRDARHEAHNE